MKYEIKYVKEEEAQKHRSSFLKPIVSYVNKIGGLAALIPGEIGAVELDGKNVRLIVGEPPKADTTVKSTPKPEKSSK